MPASMAAEVATLIVGSESSGSCPGFNFLFFDGESRGFPKSSGAVEVSSATFKVYLGIVRVGKGCEGLVSIVHRI